MVTQSKIIVWAVSLAITFVLCGLFAGALTAWHFSQINEDPISAVSQASSTIPYVTHTEAFLAYLSDALDETDVTALQHQIRELYTDAPYGEQHMSSHYFGEVLYGEKGAGAFPLCEDWYGYGCYHGFLLAAIDQEGYQVVPFLDKACRDKHGFTMETETCQHGIGHGLLELSRHDPRKAVEACDLVDDVYPKLGCASGVFMEYFAPTQSNLQSAKATIARPTFNPNDPFDVCAEFSGTTQATCLFEMQSWWSDIGMEPRKVEELCNTVENVEAREFCLIGYGNHKGPYIHKAQPYCDAFVEQESHALCRAGMLWAAEHHYDQQDAASACNDLEGEYQSMCFEKGRFTCEVEGRC